MKFRIRKPRLNVSKKGKISLSGGGFSVGGNGGRVNVSKSGVSSTVGGKGMSYNTRRGMMNCGFVMLLAVGVGVGSLAGAVSLLVA